jgi:exodeoxyribonuclease V alpha subunit
MSINKYNQHEQQPKEKISGHIERITFHNEDNGFCILKAKVTGFKDLITIVGNAANICIGELLEAEGAWIQDKKYGLQFKADQLKTIPPSTIEGIEKYLGSGMIKGIGPHFAKKLIKAFAAQVFDVIENHPNKLKKVAGIGEKRQQMILKSWQEQKNVRQIMVFLHGHGLGTMRAVRIYKTYGENAINIITENPYRLVQDIHGIGFKTADALAIKLGIAKDSIIRASAGIRYTLLEFSNRGHCAAYVTELITKATELLEIPEEIIIRALNKEKETANIITENIVKDCETKEIAFLAPLYHAEVSVAKNIKRINFGLPPWGKIESEKAIQWVFEKTGLELSPSQKKAVFTVLNSKVAIITGGPGVGKTTIINTILKIARAKKLRVSLCAPTGRASKRLSEATGFDAKTIHRMLGFTPDAASFTRNQKNPLATDFVIIDEASMIDITLINSLLKAIPTHAALLIVGDIDQLPSIGPGALLQDLIQSDTIPTVTLTEIFRQARDSKIIVNAHRINQGQFPLCENNDDGKFSSDFIFLEASTPEEIQNKLIHMVTKVLPQKFNLNPLTEIQVLTPMHRGTLGSQNLNSTLQQTLNGKEQNKITRFGWTFSVNDKIIQNVNNYDKDVFNGDIGTIKIIDSEENTLHASFDGRIIEYDFSELDEIALAYAISIHKSQGSEYPAIVIPIATQHYMMLARNLIYTAITRGKKLVVLVGQTKALAMAIKNAATKQRLTNLHARLQEEE